MASNQSTNLTLTTLIFSLTEVLDYIMQCIEEKNLQLLKTFHRFKISNLFYLLPRAFYRIMKPACEKEKVAWNSISHIWNQNGPTFRVSIQSCDVCHFYLLFSALSKLMCIETEYGSKNRIKFCCIDYPSTVK